MEKIIHINNTDLFAINKISELGNSEELSQNIETDFQYSLFSTMFMSGAEYIQLDKSLVNKKILENPFWKDKFINLLTDEYITILNKANGMLIPHLHWNQNGLPMHPHNLFLSSYLGNLLYSSKTGIPSVVSRFKDEKDLEWIKPAVKSEFHQNFTTFQKLIKKENIDTISPKYSVLKKEVRIFEDITGSPLYRDYQNLHSELKFSDKISTILKDIKVFSLKLHYKYLGNFDLKKSTFGYLRNSTAAFETLDSKTANIAIDLLEHISSGDKKVVFYAFEDADYQKLIHRRLQALADNGDEDIKKLIESLRND